MTDLNCNQKICSSLPWRALPEIRQKASLSRSKLIDPPPGLLFINSKNTYLFFCLIWPPLMITINAHSRALRNSWMKRPFLDLARKLLQAKSPFFPCLVGRIGAGRETERMRMLRGRVGDESREWCWMWASSSDKREKRLLSYNWNSHQLSIFPSFLSPSIEIFAKLFNCFIRLMFAVSSSQLSALSNQPHSSEPTICSEQRF